MIPLPLALTEALGTVVRVRNGEDVGDELLAKVQLALFEAIDSLEGGGEPAQLADVAPALARWGREVLAGQGRRSALEKAAAWELAAMQYEAEGDEKRANEARAKARRAILRRAA